MNFWERLGHMLTAWRHYRLPAPEQVAVPKSRRPVEATQPVQWPASFAALTATLAAASVNYHGVGNGNPMQNGTARARRLTWGVAEWGQQHLAEIPLPASGWYWVSGFPNPPLTNTIDRHCIIAAPNGDVHELIQFDPTAPARALPWPNQALGWGRWRDGQLVEGVAITGTGQPMHPYIWGAGSAKDPHELAIVLPDYVGGDGLLDAGPRAGGRYALDRNSASYRDAVTKGGECAIAAEALAAMGCVVVDRNGYSDSPNNRTTRGTKPHPPGLLRQAGDRAGNVHLLRVRLGDLREAV